METKIKLIPSIYLYGGEIIDTDTLLDGISPEILFDYATYCETLCHGGADELLIFDLSDDDAGHEANLARIKDIADIVEIPILAGGNVKRLEDVKKYIYAGAARAILNMGVAANENMIQEASARFGKDRIAVYTTRMPGREEAERWAEQGAGLLILEQGTGVPDCGQTGYTEQETDMPDRKQTEQSELDQDDTPVAASAFMDVLRGTELPVLWMTDAAPEDLPELYSKLFKSSIKNLRGSAEMGDSQETVDRQTMGLHGISLPVFRDTTTPLMQYKHRFAAADMNVFLLESPRPFSEFKKNSDGLIPVIVQDYRTNEVLMLAYMNEEAFDHTLACGRMTYYSRSRKELWEKGLTSGHFQYVKSLSIDCDDDTLLAKVYQVGAACHTGHRSCFYRDLVPGTDQANPLTVFDDVYGVIMDRKEHPKEGSYTNYLFDKGIDKILKKVGEEATEIVIAAKNPDPKETVYEISDLLYHMMVLMAEKGISWKEVTTELARR